MRWQRLAFEICKAPFLNPFVLIKHDILICCMHEQLIEAAVHIFSQTTLICWIMCLEAADLDVLDFSAFIDFIEFHDAIFTNSFAFTQGLSSECTSIARLRFLLLLVVTVAETLVVPLSTCVSESDQT